MTAKLPLFGIAAASEGSQCEAAFSSRNWGFASRDSTRGPSQSVVATRSPMARADSRCCGCGIAPQNCHDCDLSLFLNPQ
jgi:hypothetical protein